MRAREAYHFNSMSVPEILFNLVSSSGDGKFFPRTEIYKEGWMIKILMAINSQSSCFPFQTMEGSSWFSEAQLLTARARRPNRAVTPFF